MLVVDAGALVDLLIDGHASAEIRRLVSRPPGRVGAPAHIDMEVMNALRSLRRSRKIDRGQADALTIHLIELPVSRHPLVPLGVRIWELSENFSPYDAAYVALAEQLEAPLLTGDARLARATERHTLVTVFSV